MACVSDYPKPTELNRRLQETAEMLLYADTFLRSEKFKYKGLVFTSIEERAAAIQTADNQFAYHDYAPRLCKILRDFKEADQKGFDRLVYSAKNPLSRRMADWWEDHGKADKECKKRKKRVQDQGALEIELQVFVEGLTSQQATLLKKILKSSTITDSALACIAARESEE